MWAFGTSYLVARLTVYGFALFGGVYAYRLFCRTHGRPVALAALGVLGVAPLVFTYSAYVLLEVPTLALVLASVFHFERYLGEGRARDAILACLFAAFAALTRFDGVLLLPPTIYRANRSEVIEHYTKVNEVGLPIMAYNNPIDTKVDLTPDLVAELFELEHVVAVKEFSLDARRVREIRDLCDIDVIAGADDLLFEALVAGATGWFAGYPNAFPREAVRLYELLTADRVAEARALFAEMAPVFAWDSKTEFVQAIKFSIDVAGESTGGPTRPPRGPLSPEQQAVIRRDTERALAAGAALRAA